MTAPATTWTFAEGATGPWFDMFLLLANPSATTAAVEVTYLLEDGPSAPQPRTLAPFSRETIWVDRESLDDGRPLENVATSVRITADVPILAERAMWWPGSVASWYEAHDGFGATSACSRWAVAEGEWTAATTTYGLIANTGSTPAMVQVTALPESGVPLDARLDVAAGARANIDIAALFPSLAGQRFGLRVDPAPGHAEAPLVVEWALYTDVGPQRWAAGAAALATCLH